MCIMGWSLAVCILLRLFGVLKVFVWKFIDCLFMIDPWCLIFPMPLLSRQCACRLALIPALGEASKQFSVFIHGLREGKPVTSQPVKKFWESLWWGAWWVCYWRPWVGCWYGSWASGMPTAWVHRYGLRGLGMVLICESWAWHWYPSSLLGLKQLILLLVLYWSTGDRLILGSTKAGLLIIC